MKWIVITALRTFADDVRNLLEGAGIPAFFYQEVIGYRDLTEVSVGNNWFASEQNEHQALMVYAFAKETQVNRLFEAVQDFNKHEESVSLVHMSVLQVERSNHKEVLP